MSTEPQTQLEPLPPERVAELASHGEAVLVDVRRPDEFEGGHIRAATNIEINELTARAEELPRDRPVVFYCRGGGRSQMAAEAFRQAGYDAQSMAGGLSAWVESGRELEPDGGEVVEPPPPS